MSYTQIELFIIVNILRDPMCSTSLILHGTLKLATITLQLLPRGILRKQSEKIKKQFSL